MYTIFFINIFHNCCADKSSIVDNKFIKKEKKVIINNKMLSIVSLYQN